MMYRITPAHLLQALLHGCITCRFLNELLFPPAGIRLAGATSDVHIMNVRTGKWDRATPAGEAPSPRAAHAAAAVGSMVVVQVLASFLALRLLSCLLSCLLSYDRCRPRHAHVLS